MMFLFAPLALFVIAWLFTGSAGKALVVALIGELVLLAVMGWAWHTVDLAFKCAVHP